MRFLLRGNIMVLCKNLIKAQHKHKKAAHFAVCSLL